MIDCGDAAVVHMGVTLMGGGIDEYHERKYIAGSLFVCMCFEMICWGR